METPQNPTVGPGFDPITARAQLIAKVSEFHERVELYLPGRYSIPTELIAEYADIVMRSLDPDRPSLSLRASAAREVLRVLFGGGLHADADFWRTDLGQMLYAAGDYPKAYLSVSEAAAVLRVGRQRMHQLLTGGKLERSTVVDGSPVSRLALRERWEKMQAVSA